MEDIRKFLGRLFHELARQKESTIIEGHMPRDHVHMCITIPPKYSVSSIIGFLKGKSAIELLLNTIQTNVEILMKKIFGPESILFQQ